MNTTKERIKRDGVLILHMYLCVKSTSQQPSQMSFENFKLHWFKSKIQILC